MCVKGSDKPLDLALIIDSSDSIDSVFHDQITFVIERVVQNINIHPDAVRLALVTYAGRVFLHFGFNDLVYGRNNTAVIRHLNELTSIKGTTSTDQALKFVYDMFTDPTQNSGPHFFTQIFKKQKFRSEKECHKTGNCYHRRSFVTISTIDGYTFAC